MRERKRQEIWGCKKAEVANRSISRKEMQFLKKLTELLIELGCQVEHQQRLKGTMTVREFNIKHYDWTGSEHVL